MARPRKKPLFQLNERDPLRCLIAALRPSRDSVSLSGQQIEAAGFEQARLESLERSNLIRSDSIDMTTDCSRCERQCMGLSVMKTKGGTLGFACPYFPSVGWIDVKSKQIERKRFLRSDLIRWLVHLFGCQPIYFIEEPELPAGCYRLGIVLVEEKRLQLFLQFDRKRGWWLKCAENDMALQDLLRYNGSEYVVDPDLKEMLLWADDSDEPSIARAARLLEEVDWRKSHKDEYPGPVYEQIAKENGMKKTTLEGILKKTRSDKTTLDLKRIYRQKRLEREKTKLST